MSASSRCADVPLTILAGGKEPHSARVNRMSRRRFTVLIAIQVILIAHVVLWFWKGGETLGPVEPSESMQTVKEGIITVGTIVFAIGLLSTAILGRWFCGWGCHVIFLQDWCERLMARAGIRPKPFRSRFLLWVPLGMALYMFVWPVVYRLAIAPYVQPDLTWPGWRWHLTTTDFWATFPTWAVAIPFLFVCGFVTVYLLGAKAYCSYGCPYGGFFAPLDRFARGRIRVNDDCEGCGHCTAVCSSNVRVHEEVRDFKMVVDPGCMKCLDCVAACPKDALSFGFGPAPAAAQAPAAARLYDLPLREEVGIAIVGVGTLLAVRGAYGAVPLLFASGIGACVAFIAWNAWRLLHDADASFHGLVLKRGGKFKSAGSGWVVGAVVMLLLVLHTGVINVATTLGSNNYATLDYPEEALLGDSRVAPDEELMAAARAAVSQLTLASNIGSGGWGLGTTGWQNQLDLRRAWAHCILGELDVAEALIYRMNAQAPTEALTANLIRLRRAQGDAVGAERLFEASITEHPEWGRMRDERIQVLLSEGRFDDAIGAARAWCAASPDDLRGMRRLSLLLLDSPDVPAQEEGIALVEKTLVIDPTNGFAWYTLGIANAERGRLDVALPSLERAYAIEPTHPAIREALARAYTEIGRPADAARVLAPGDEAR